MKLALTNLGFAGPYDFEVCRERPNVQLMRKYFFQILNSNFGLSDFLIGKMEELCIEKDEISDTEISGILEEAELIPQFFYYFSQSHLELNECSDDAELYTAIKNISFDQGGLVIMECFCSQIYVLCTSKGTRLTDYCHDLDMGLNGVIYFRTSDINGEFATAQFRRETQSLESVNMNMNFIECFIFNELNAKRDYLPWQFEPNITDGEYKFLLGNGDLNWLKGALKANEVNWVCAPWLVETYHSEFELAIAAIRNDYKVFSLLLLSQKQNKEVLNEFAQFAPFEYFYSCFFSFSLPDWPLRNREFCRYWVSSSSVAFEFISDEMKNDQEMIELNRSWN